MSSSLLDFNQIFIIKHFNFVLFHVNFLLVFENISLHPHEISKSLSFFFEPQSLLLGYVISFDVLVFDI